MFVTASTVVSNTRYHDGALIPYLTFVLYFRNFGYELYINKYYEYIQWESF